MNIPSDKTLSSIANSLPKEQFAWISNVAHAYLQGQQYNKALPLFLLLLKLQPDNVSPLKSMAYVYYQLGQYQRAIQCCERYEKKLHNITTPALHLLRSFCHLKTGQYELACNYHQQYIAARIKP